MSHTAAEPRQTGLNIIGRYAVDGIARALVGRRIDGEVVVFDLPAEGPGPRYVVESGFESKAELAVLLAHYKRHAEQLGACPMSGEAIDRALGLR